MPSRAAARAGLVTTASLSVALLAGLPALAADSPLEAGKPCPLDLTALESLGLVCNEETKLLDPLVLPTETPTLQPPASETPTAPDLPVDVPGGSTPLPPGGTTPDQQPPPGGGSLPLPDDTDTPAAPDQETDPDQGAPTGGAPGEDAGETDPATPPGTSIRAAATTLDPASTSKSMLVAATSANLAVSDVPSLAAMRSLSVIPGGKPLSAYTPLPLLATPTATALATVQAPLLAVGDEAAAGGGFTLAGLSSEALPGLLVVLATALVASVGAGNLRVWQDRYAAARRR